MKNSDKISVRNSLIRKWIKDSGCDGFAAFDFKNKDIILYDSGLVSIKNKIKVHRKRRKAPYGEDLRISKLACTIWFDSLDETIDYLISTRKLLNKLGYSTSKTIKAKDL
jgi:hypothetical protein